jgi:hypothetical protein
MKEFTTTIDIGAPAGRVWQVMSDTDRWHEWTPSVSSVKRLGDEPFAVGSRVLIHQPKLPPAFWTVTAIEPERSFTWVSTAPGLRVVGRHSVAPAATGAGNSIAPVSRDVRRSFARMTKGNTARYIALGQGLKARSEFHLPSRRGRR